MSCSHNTQSEAASSPPKGSRPHLQPADVCVGCIVWLPPKDPDNQHEIIKCNKISCCAGQELNELGYDHPVVVLRITQRKGSVVWGDLVFTVATITTFRSMPLDSYRRKRIRTPHFQSSIPIYQPDSDVENCQEEDISIQQLRLEEKKLRKQSYISLKHTYEVPISTLRNYGYRRCRAYKFRLNSASYNTLMTDLGMPVEKFESTGTLWETVDRRLGALVANQRVHPTPQQETHYTENPPHNNDNNHGLYFQPVSSHLPPRNYGTIASRPQHQHSYVQYPTHHTERNPRLRGYNIPSTTHMHVPEPADDDGLLSRLVKAVVGLGIVGFLVWQVRSLAI